MNLNFYLNAIKRVSGTSPTEVFSSSDIPAGTGYVYLVCNGDHLLTLGKSGKRKARADKGRLYPLLKGARPGIHNKSFIVGIAPVAFGNGNRYFLSPSNDPEAAEQEIHHLLGIRTSVTPAVILLGKQPESIEEASRFLFERALKQLAPDSEAMQEYFAVLHLVLKGLSFKRRNGKTANYRSGDVLCGSILRSADQLHLASAWQRLCNEYFRYDHRYLSGAARQTDRNILELEPLPLQGPMDATESDSDRQTLDFEVPILVQNLQLQEAKELLDRNRQAFTTKDFQFETNHEDFVFVIEKPGEGTKLDRILADLDGRDLSIQTLEPSNHKTRPQFFSDYGSCFFLQQSFQMKREGYFHWVNPKIG